MRAGSRNTYIISWSQAELDGLDNAKLSSVCEGAVWRWRGEAMKLDHQSVPERLDNSNREDARRHAAQIVRTLVTKAVCGLSNATRAQAIGSYFDHFIVITDGVRRFVLTLIEFSDRIPPVLMVQGALPPQDTEFWVAEHSLIRRSRPLYPEGSSRGVICFTPGTRISTPQGSQLVETLREGDLVLTKDSGPQEIRWAGRRRVSGARLFAMPALRPVRIRAGALGIERPDQELIVSPDHRMLIKGAAARDLFNTPEVLVSARDLINGSTVVVDKLMNEVTYVHLLLDTHQILWANGVESDSFHPGNSDLHSLSDQDRDRLLRACPNVACGTTGYGEFARRNLSKAEAAILMHEAA